MPDARKTSRGPHILPEAFWSGLMRNRHCRGQTVRPLLHALPLC